MRKRLWPELLVVLGLTVLALAVRLYRLPEIPAGLYGDEAVNGLDVLDILNGQHPVFFERNNGREPLFIYLQAVAVAILGITPFALRVTAAVIGAATVPALYWMVREAFTGRSDARWLALWTALCLALSYWHLIFSRIGFRAIMLPFLTCISFAWFWRAWWRLERGDRLPWTNLILCGISLGMALYTYLAARFLPGLFLLVAGAGILQARRLPALRRRRILATAVVLAAAAVVFLPLGLYFLNHPGDFIKHAADTSFLGPHLSDRNKLPLELARSVAKTIGMFGVLADGNDRHDPALRPVFDPLLAACLAGGVVLAARRWRGLPYFSAVAWLGVLALPAILTFEAPNSIRMLAVVPAACLLAALAMLEAGRRLVGNHPWLACWLPLPILLLSGVLGVNDYFRGSQNNGDLASLNNVRLAKAAPFMSSRNRPEGIWLIPIWPTGFLPNTAGVIEFLTRGQVAWSPVRSLEQSAPEELARMTPDWPRAYVLEWLDAGPELADDYVYRDAKHLVSFLLHKHGRPVGEGGQDHTVFTAYELPAVPDYRVAEHIVPTDISFDGKVKLIGNAYGHTAISRDEPAAALEEKWLPSGHDAWAVLRWKAQVRQLNNKLKVSLYLTDEDGHLAGQVDDLLVSDRYLVTDRWVTGEEASTYHILPTLPAIPPGRYRLYAAVYSTTNMQRLPVLDANGVPGAPAAYLGNLEITHPIPGTAPGLRAPLEVTPASPLPTGTHLGSDLTLLGYDLLGRTIGPGERLALTLYWRAQDKPAGDYVVGVELQDDQGQTIIRQEGRPASGRYPTTEWPAGEAVRDWRDLAIPPDTPTGSYNLVVTLGEGEGQLGTLDLGTVEIAGHPRYYALPTTQYPQTYKLGDSIAFVGYDLATTKVSAESPFNLTLYWQALGPVDKSYTVFVHLLGSDGRVRTQQDSSPGGGALPTTGWVPGEYITDPYQLAVKPETPPGDYELEIGMYDPATGARLAITDAAGQPAGDRILLGQPIRITSQ